jgi:hypothetical protein
VLFCGLYPPYCAGAGSEVSWSAVKSGKVGEISARDAFTDAPLSGHLIGRHTWRPVLPGKGHTAAQVAKMKAFQDSLTFDPAVNVNSGDKILRAQLLGEQNGVPSDANPPEARGSPSVSATEALDAVRTQSQIFVCI